MSWLDELFAPVQNLPFPMPELGQPRPLGQYAFDAGVERQMEQLVNLFAPIIGFPKVILDGVLSAADAARVVQIQRALYDDYTCDGAARQAGLAKLETALDVAAQLAQKEKGISVTPEQMWCSQNQTGITTKLPQIAQAIGSGALKRCTTIPWLWIGLGAGAVVLLGRKR